MTDRTLLLLRKLDSIGGWVDEEEVRYHLGDAAAVDLVEAETVGLVESRTQFTLTKLGEATARAEVAA